MISNENSNEIIKWFAKNQASDFHWKPYWQSPRSKQNTLLTHNMPFDIYSIKHSCGPFPVQCLNFDFRKIPGEYTEYSIKAQFITDENIQSKADLLMEQYTRTASLFPHNVALIPVGDDFRYNHEKEFNQQYENYKKLIDYINANSATRYRNATIQFGTPIDYFRAIEKRQNHKFPSLVGDFFVYADIFNEGRPAYWSGYFTTRPFYKLMSRDLEHNLRSLEILFTLAFNKARQHNLANAFKVYEKNYEKIIQVSCSAPFYLIIIMSFSIKLWTILLCAKASHLFFHKKNIKIKMGRHLMKLATSFGIFSSYFENSLLAPSISI
jgi:alpha-mannosidase